MKTKLYLIAGLVIGVSLTLGSFANAQFVPLPPNQGGTGTSTAPTYGQLLVGNAGGTYTLTATSSLGIFSSDGSGTVSTSTVPTVGQLAYWTSNAFPSLLGSVATTSLTASSPLSLSQAISVIGSSASALSLDTSGTWSGNAGTVTNGVYTTDTGTVTNTMLAGSIAASKLSLTKGNFIVGNDAGTAQATSTIFISSTGNVGIGTTEPTTPLYVKKDQAAQTTILVQNTNSGGIANVKAFGDQKSFGFGVYGSAAATYGAIEANNGYVYGASDFVIMADNATANIKFATGGSSEKVRIDSTGNVGIGTTSPGTLLSIGGDATGINFRDGTTATSTISGHLRVKGNLQVDGAFFAPVTLVSSGDATINGALTVTGATTLATSLTGLLRADSGVVSVASAGTDYENPLTFNYPLSRATNAISLAFGTTTSNTWAGTQTFTNAPVLTSLATAAGTFLAVNGSGTIIATTTPSSSSVGSGTTGQFPYYAANGTTLTATSTLSIATDGTLTIDNGLAGDASTQYGATSHEWTVGYDVTDNSFAVASSTVLGTNNALTIDKNLLVTMGYASTTQLSATKLYGALTGNASTATALASDPTDCGANTWANAIAASGNLTCAAVTYAGITAMTSANFAGLITDETGTAGTVVLSVAPTFTGVSNFANASSTQMTIDASGRLYIPAGTNPTVNAAGDIAINTTTASSSVRYFDGTAERSLFPDGNGGLPFASSTLDYLGAYGAAGTTTLKQIRFSRPASLLSFYCDTDIGTAYVTIGNGTASTTGACSTAGTKTTSSVTWTMGQVMYIGIGTIANAPNIITISPQIRKDTD